MATLKLWIEQYFVRVLPKIWNWGRITLTLSRRHSMPIKRHVWFYRGHMKEEAHLLLGGPGASLRKFWNWGSKKCISDKQKWFQVLFLKKRNFTEQKNMFVLVQQFNWRHPYQARTLNLHQTSHFHPSCPCYLLWVTGAPRTTRRQISPVTRAYREFWWIATMLLCSWLLLEQIFKLWMHF